MCVESRNILNSMWIRKHAGIQSLLALVPVKLKCQRWVWCLVGSNCLDKISNKSSILPFRLLSKNNFVYTVWSKMFNLIKLQRGTKFSMSVRVMALVGGHRLRTPSEDITFTAKPKIYSHSQIFWYCQSIFCLPHRHKFLRFMPLLDVRSPC